MIRVLLVDDSPIALLSINRILDTTSDIEVVGRAANGEEALALIPKLNPDVICTDLHMPVMVGLTAIRRIRDSERNAEMHLPILAVTADAMVGDREKCLEHGADGYLSKPFSQTELIREMAGGPVHLQKCDALF